MKMSVRLWVPQEEEKRQSYIEWEGRESPLCGRNGNHDRKQQVMLLLVRLLRSSWCDPPFSHAVSLTRCHPSSLAGNAQALTSCRVTFPSPVCLAESGRPSPDRKPPSTSVFLFLYSFHSFLQFNGISRQTRHGTALAEAWCNPELSGVGVAVNIQTPNHGLWLDVTFVSQQPVYTPSVSSVVRFCDIKWHHGARSGLGGTCAVAGGRSRQFAVGN
ncbi:hypothetical protein B0T20DRAFT_219282 [Sordaria brevicollis]|uniref:Uncharacterized protein n=1 Tax=Sordaria brevicollis TaxID=83679 RepID=A0AAE0PF93_SORBR|nr:hypothetical protein B0T20DRAFT_219282 [Sordaria brevicollis]